MIKRTRRTFSADFKLEAASSLSTKTTPLLKKQKPWVLANGQLGQLK
ncbi:hypothetical protein [Escherichia coli]|nr:hypothetical protein [Escherichia coli]HCL8592524.1 hypothetical protein [Escherichia coli]HCT2693645.1 hypothetical protein [Escherichia coli]HCW2638148.1 hypothetical protein [Escherichia coli]HDL9624962.1 hypothetical protein [Escherichia coli]